VCLGHQVSHPTLGPSRITRKSYGPRVPDRTMVCHLTNVLLAGFGTDRLRCEQAMKTAYGRKPKPLGHSARQPRSRRGRSEQISFDQVGCEARKIPALGEIFFLTSSFIELPRHMLHAPEPFLPPSVQSQLQFLRREFTFWQEPVASVLRTSLGRGSFPSRDAADDRRISPSRNVCRRARYPTCDSASLVQTVLM